MKSWLILIAIFATSLPGSAQDPIFLELGTIEFDEVTGEGSVEMMMTSTVPIAGFQFDLTFDPTSVQLTNAVGGLADTYGYTVGWGPTTGTVLGYSLTLVEIPATLVPAQLLTVTFACSSCSGTAPEICIEGPVFAEVNANGIPTSVGPCDTASALPLFLRGDCNTDSNANLADAIFLLANLFSGGPDSDCVDGCDCNDDNSLNIADAVYFLSYLFNGGAPPAPPGIIECGLDPTDDSLDCLLPAACP